MACILSSQWDIIRSELLRSSYKEKLVGEIAFQIGQKWPNRHRSKTLGDYLTFPFDKLHKISSFGDGKIHVLLLCVVQAYLNKMNINSNSCKVPLNDWNIMVNALSESPIKEELITRFANELDLNWPVSHQNDQIKKYIRFSLHEISSLPGFGVKKTETIYKCIKYAYQQSKDYTAPVDTLLSLKELCEVIKSSVNPRNIAIWLRRYAKSNKLSEIGDEFRLTRERVRQLIDHTNKKIISIFETEIQELLRIIKKGINCRGYQIVENLIQSYAIEDDSIFNALLTMLQNEQQLFIIKYGNIFLWGTDFEKLSDRILQYLFQSAYPIDLKKFETKFPFQPLDFLIKLIKEKHNFHTDEHFGYFSNLSTNQLCYFALNTKKTALSTEEMQDFITKNFKIELNSHVIQASLSRISKLYIVDRGTYILEEFLDISSDDLKHLTELCFRRIKQLGDFIKADNLYDELIIDFPQYEEKDLTPYLLLSLAQNDARFKTAPGLMIGLTSFADAESLEQIIKNIIIDSGPISVPELQRILKEKYFRTVLGVTFQPILEKNIDIIQCDRGKFNSLYKYVTSEGELNKIIQAIQIILMHKCMSAYSVFSHFRLIDKWGLNEYIIKSILVSSDIFLRKKELFFLVKPHPQIKDYFHSTIPYLENHDRMIRYVKRKLGDSYLPYIEIDYRLKMKGAQLDGKSPLKEILKEYGF